MHPPLTLSIIVPVYNEEATVASVMEQLSQACAEAQIIYIDDGSNDPSLRLLKEHARPQDVVLTKPNGGKGSAVREGLKHVQGAFTVIQDADLEYDPREIKMLLKHAEQHSGHVVFGSRFLKPNPNLYKRYLIGNKVLTACVNVLFRGRLTDAYTCYKLFPTETLKRFPLKAHGFELEAELCARTLKARIPIDELPISYAPRSLEEGKKIGLSDAWKGVLMMLQIRFTQ